MTSDEPAERTVADERSLSPMRRTIASRLQESYQEAVHVTVSRAVSAESMLAAADTELGGDGEPVEPSVVDVLVCALSETLAEHPAFNATFEDGTHRVYEEHNLGVAVDIDDGLVTPVLEDVGSKSLATITAERRRLTERVQTGQYSMSTFQGGTFTVSNLGPLGVDSFTPVINPPEVAILGVNRIREAVVPDENSEHSVGTEKRLTLDLSFDHRVVDGADAARFLGTLAKHLGDAEQYVE
ncbi:MAG: 2-oxo acid dehydrogenase subunit E2 [Halobellus sp.]|uniref:2-oxo acid dehydrogenase subunit E2 n=1 Tax=Halobellus sp. TaxID=1979212 RepID=UPI0035D411EE